MIQPPTKDTILERAKFHTALCSEIECWKVQMNGVHGDLGRDIESLKKSIVHVHEELDNCRNFRNQTEVRTKTVLAIITVLWILFSAVFGWVWDKATTRAEMLMEEVGKIQQEKRDTSNQINNLINEISSIKSIKGQIMTIQSDLDNLMQQVKK